MWAPRLGSSLPEMRFRPTTSYTPTSKGVVYIIYVRFGIRKVAEASTTNNPLNIHLTRSTHPSRGLFRGGLYYQLAFLTPGIKPFEAISRNWIRLIPN